MLHIFIWRYIRRFAFLGYELFNRIGWQFRFEVDTVPANISTKVPRWTKWHRRLGCVDLIFRRRFRFVRIKRTPTYRGFNRKLCNGLLVIMCTLLVIVDLGNSVYGWATCRDPTSNTAISAHFGGLLAGNVRDINFVQIAGVLIFLILSVSSLNLIFSRFRLR